MRSAIARSRRLILLSYIERGASYVCMHMHAYAHPHSPHGDACRRPIVIVALQSQQSILFGRELGSAGSSPEAETKPPHRILMPLGSALVIDGYGADVSKHCLPPVTSDFIGITFRKIGITMAPYSGPHATPPDARSKPPAVSAAPEAGAGAESGAASSAASADNLDAVLEIYGVVAGIRPDEIQGALEDAMNSAVSLSEVRIAVWLR